MTAPDTTSQIEEGVRSILTAVGEDVTREGLIETPNRVARMYFELFSGLSEDPSVHLKKQFTTPSNSMVIVKKIPFYSACEHHLVPFHGVAHVGYLPGRVEGGEKLYRIAGLSKFARVVDGFARRPQVQENLTQQVLSCIQEALNPKGVIVVMKAMHMCMSMRGVEKEGAETVTSAVSGMFDTNQDDVKGEFFRLLGDV